MHDTTAILNLPVSPGPCDPVNVTSNLQCGSDTATISWVEAANAVAYTVLAQEGMSDQYVSCRSNTTSCQLNHLQCGKVYNLTVLAEDAVCNSTGVRGVLITGRQTSEKRQTDQTSNIQSPLISFFVCVSLIAPCSPSVQSNTLICGNSSALLSWTTMAHATGYTVKATAADGTSISCSSPTASCTLTDLLCSETYLTTVTAHGNQCDSAPGSSTNITTGERCNRICLTSLAF